PRADAEDDSVGKHRPEGAESLRDHRGVIAERRCEHTRTHDDPLRPGTHRTEPRQRKRCMTMSVAKRLEVIADPDRVPTETLDSERVIEELRRTELLGRCFVSDSQGHGSPRATLMVVCYQTRLTDHVTPATARTCPSSSTPSGCCSSRSA